MKSVTEFPNFTLNQGLTAKAALTAEGKSAEEIEQSLGASFKYEGDRLKHFIHALDVAGENQENLKRVVVMSLSEGDNIPSKAKKVEEHHYVPEFRVDPKRMVAGKSDGKGGRGKGGRPGQGGGGKKESPWGLSPEEKAAKTGKGAAAKASKPS